MNPLILGIVILFINRMPQSSLGNIIAVLELVLNIRLAEQIYAYM